MAKIECSFEMGKKIPLSVTFILLARVFDGEVEIEVISIIKQLSFLNTNIDCIL